MRSLQTLLLLAYVVGSCFGVAAAAGADAGPWPQWRGPTRNDLSTETGLLSSWSGNGPELLWTFREAGKGYAGPAIVGKTLLSIGADDRSEFVFAVDVSTGKELWRKAVSGALTNGWGDGPRSTPAIDGARVYVLSGVGELACLDLASGEVKWSKSLVKDFGGKVPMWGYTESPLVDGDNVVVTPGGKNCLVALNKQTGANVWTSRGVGNEKGVPDSANYASLIVASVGDVRMYVGQTGQALVGVSAKSGEMLWRSTAIPRKTAVIPTPIFHGDSVYATADYGAGCELVALRAEAGKVVAKQRYANKNMENHHGGVILKDGCIYGYSGNRRGAWRCQDFETGEVKWSESKELEKGSIAYADGRFYCLGEDTGRVFLIEASPDKWKAVGNFELPEKTKTPRKQGKIWTHPVVADGKLYLRDQDLLFCFNVKAK